jgi:uncharacterized protein
MLVIPEKYKLNSYEIIMTWDCNLRCVYCYECQAGKTTAEMRKTNKAPLTSEKINEIIDFIVETHDKDAREIQVIFWGGEPFLAFEQIKEMIGKLEAAQEAGKIKKQIGYTTTSNLTVITLEQMQYLQNKRFSFLVSFDGLENTTDGNRGQGTFAKVVRNMALLHGLKIPFQIRMTVLLAQDKALKNNLNFVNDLDYPFWWSIDCTREQLNEDNIQALLNVLLQFYRQPRRNNDETLNRYLKPKGQNLCIDPHKQVTIDPEGNLRICSRADWPIGNIQEGITGYAEVRDLPFYSGQPHAVCADCLVYERCKGGCLGAHLEKNKIKTVKYKLNNNYCKEMFLLQLLNENLILGRQYAEFKEAEKNEGVLV